MADAPLPIFHPDGLKPALVFKKNMGELKKLKKAPRGAPSRRPEADYVRRLNIVLSRLSELVDQIVVPRIGAIVSDSPLELRRRIDVGELLETSINDLRVAFGAEAPYEQIARGVGSGVEVSAGAQQKAIVSTVLGVSPELAEPWLTPMIDQFAKSNARLVTSVSEDFIDRLDRRISDRMKEGLRAEEIARDIQADFVSTQGLETKRARSRAKLIARDQTASLQADVTRVRQTQLGVRRYIWRTANDERVRQSHDDRDGVIFEWGRPIQPQLAAQGLTIDTIDGHPGRPINCRCYAEPVLQDVLPDGTT